MISILSEDCDYKMLRPLHQTHLYLSRTKYNGVNFTAGVSNIQPVGGFQPARPEIIMDLFSEFLDCPPH